MNEIDQSYAFGSFMVLLAIMLAVRFVLRRIARAQGGRLNTLPIDDRRIIDVSLQARRARRWGLLLLVVLYYIVLSALATTAAAISLPTVLYVVITFAFISLMFQVLRARRSREFLRRIPVITRARIGSFVVYGLAAATSIWVVAMVVVGQANFRRAADTVRGQDQPDPAALGQQALALVMMLFGLALTAILPILFRAGRRFLRLHAADVRRRDRRTPVLYLRAFSDDKLKVEAVPSIRRPVIELLWPVVRDRFETVIAWTCDEIGPPVSIAQPGTTLANLGAAREHAPDRDHWLDYVTNEIRASRAVVLSIGATDGLIQEVNAINAVGALTKTVFLFPPVQPVEIRERWAIVAEALALEQASIPAFDPTGGLAAIVDDSGNLRVITSDRPDEASYRAALLSAFEIAGADRHRVPAAPPPLAP